MRTHDFWVGLFLILFLIAFGIIATFGVISMVKIGTNSCLENVAIKVCSEKGMLFGYKGIDGNLDPNFSCVQDLRSNDYEKFKFLKSELKECGVD